ncbi:uncharacterized protein PV09_02756 [Verruconis gallopava]|uniref:Uncharacterized protein n=1 Tax=Verruconis gallopava TaxID=253628 RepID=A0A0D1XU40_9PEZI|nr:uncharacterized protein PV09_02756 [Verruconis gallopava]KIW06286.1 hypothetical protein PV09_02756 [Verruconis gallopava]
MRTGCGDFSTLDPSLVLPRMRSTSGGWSAITGQSRKTTATCSRKQETAASADLKCGRRKLRVLLVATKSSTAGGNLDFSTSGIALRLRRRSRSDASNLRLGEARRFAVLPHYTSNRCWTLCAFFFSPVFPSLRVASAQFLFFIFLHGPLHIGPSEKLRRASFAIQLALGSCFLLCWECLHYFAAIHACVKL